MIQKHSRDVTQLLAVHPLNASVNFEEGYVFISIELIPRRVPDWANLGVPNKILLVDAEMEAKVANVKTFDHVLLGQRREVPALNPVFAEVNGLHCFNFCLRQKVLHLLLIHTVILVIVELALLLSKLSLHLLLFFLQIDSFELSLDLFRVRLYTLLINPSVIPPINTEVVDVVFVPHALFKLLNLLIHDLIDLSVILSFSPLSLLLSFELVNSLLEIALLILVFCLSLRMFCHRNVIEKRDFFSLVFLNLLLEK